MLDIGPDRLACHHAVSAAQTPVFPGHRWWPAAGAVPGVSLQEFEVEGFSIPANRTLMMCNHASLMDPTVYQAPDK